MAAMTCHTCGKEITPGTQFCLHCGAPVQGSQAVPVVSSSPASPSALPANRKSKTTAGILALLLGGIGVHKFYLGKTGAGILYLVFFWTYIPAIVGFVEGIVYLTMSEEDFYRKYAKELTP